MKHRPIFLALAGVVVLSLAACGPGGETGPAPIPAPATPVPTASPEPSPTPAPEPVAYAADVPPGSYAPWQRAYADFLAEEAERDVGKVQTENWDVSDLYRLYDADKDGVPELFIQYGSCEADYHTVCYTYREGGVEALKDGDFGSGHGMVCSCPGESAFLFCWGHMGYAEIYKVPVENGALGEWELLLEENTNPSGPGEEPRPYTAPGELVPGAERLDYFDIQYRRWGRNQPLVLPIYDYGAYPRQADPCVEEGEVRSAIGKVLWENGEFYGCSGDNFYGYMDGGTLRDYLVGAYPYAEEPLVVREYAYADANNDGQTDCILRLEEEPDEYGNVSQYYVILALQGEEVYAYFFGFVDGAGIDPDGTVYFQEFGGWNQVSFYKNQCYDLSAPHEPVEGCDLAWDEYAPNL